MESESKFWRLKLTVRSCWFSGGEIGQGSGLKQTSAAENERCAFKLYTYFFEQGSKISKKFVNLHGKTKSCFLN